MQDKINWENGQMSWIKVRLTLGLQNYSSWQTTIWMQAFFSYCEPVEHLRFFLNSEPFFIEAWYRMSSAISRNTQITDKNKNWTRLCSLYIKRLNLALSVSIKATKELHLLRQDLMFSSLYFRLVWLFTSASLLLNTFVLFSNKQLFVFRKLIIFLFMFDYGSK